MNGVFICTSNARYVARRRGLRIRYSRRASAPDRLLHQMQSMSAPKRASCCITSEQFTTDNPSPSANDGESEPSRRLLNPISREPAIPSTRRPEHGPGAERPRILVAPPPAAGCIGCSGGPPPIAPAGAAHGCTRRRFRVDSRARPGGVAERRRRMRPRTLRDSIAPAGGSMA